MLERRRRKKTEMKEERKKETGKKKIKRTRGNLSLGNIWGKHSQMHTGVHPSIVLSKITCIIKRFNLSPIIC
jgi:hypothetical protein